MVNAWVLARSDRPRSWRFFTEALASDIHDVQGGTTAEGIHLGAMAGTVDLVQRCYTGLETREDVLWLNPSLPEELDGLDFDVRYRGHWGINLHLTRPPSGSGWPPRTPRPSRSASMASWPSWTRATPRVPPPASSTVAARMISATDLSWARRLRRSDGQGPACQSPVGPVAVPGPAVRP